MIATQSLCLLCAGGVTSVGRRVHRAEFGHIARRKLMLPFNAMTDTDSDKLGHLTLMKVRLLSKILLIINKHSSQNANIIAQVIVLTFSCFLFFLVQ